MCPPGPAFDRLQGLRNDSLDSANNFDASGKHFNRFGVRNKRGGLRIFTRISRTARLVGCGT